ncbi:CheY chemotaxis protein or a CheY-like REC (receiver) domain [Reichenbachiella faecimaris]|uniref:CheY chemotaxis protein or a CheY-like REC (Receiver) domain n=1 Tax=Reichenbachiella faecimaris TaxID=692418 RepID=A0A1W2GH53_REIFA|nr:response regulator [Reichenbachiella faecimaris]SMD35995.1 CheY chemotaxis protein or a CheY-like REC (receiver) domain [Reichenbachiella faecimaris]
MKVLLADQNEVNKMITQQMLTQKNITSDCVSNSEEVIEKLYNEEYALVFMDLNMLNNNVSNVEQILNQEFSNTPLIAYVNHGEDLNLANYKNRGIDEVISKPYEMADLYLTIERHTTLVTSPEEQESVLEFKKHLLEYADHDTEFAFELVDCFIKNYEEYEVSATEAFHLRDETLLFESWHKINSSNRIFSISSLDEIAENLSAAINANPSKGDSILISELTIACDKVIFKLNTIKKNLKS